MIFVIRPQDDLAAEEFSAWWELTAPYRPDGVQVVDLIRGVSRAEVERTLPESKMVFYFGHGTPGSLCQFDGSHVYVDEENIGLAANKIIVAIACSSAQVLGERAVAGEMGVAAYAGFVGDLLSVPAFHQQMGRAVMRIAEFIFQGQPTEPAVQLARYSLAEFAQECENPSHSYSSHPDSAWASCCAWANFDAFKSLGNPDARVIW